MTHPLSFLSPKTVVQRSPIHGRGLFAREKITKDEIVAVKGGHIVTGETLRELRPLLGPAEIQIADNLFIYPVRPNEREGAMLYRTIPVTRTSACAAGSLLWPCARSSRARS